MTIRTSRAVAVALAVAAMLPACSGDAPATSPPDRSAAGSSSSAAPSSQSSSPAPSAGPSVYVAVGASETVGVGADDPATQAWPVVLHERELPEARLVDLGVSGSTVEGALRSQLPAALAAGPDVATVWLAVNDLITGVPVRAYQRRLQRLVHALRRDGRTDVIVGNVPDLWRLPAYRACLPGERSEVSCVLPFVPTEAQVRAQVARFNRAVRTVVRREGARLADLSGVPFGARLTSGDGFHPSTAGHRRVAAVFARELP